MLDDDDSDLDSDVPVTCAAPAESLDVCSISSDDVPVDHVDMPEIDFQTLEKDLFPAKRTRISAKTTFPKNRDMYVAPAKLEEMFREVVFYYSTFLTFFCRAMCLIFF